MLIIAIWKVLRKANKQKYFIEVILLLIILSAGLVTYLQLVYIEVYERQENTTLDFHDLSLQNLYHPNTNSNQWQLVRGTSQKLHVYSAYYDNQGEKNLIRIIGFSEPYFREDIQCQLFFQNSETENVFVSAKMEPIVKDIEAELVAVFVTCNLPESKKIPRAVSLVAGSETMISNLLLVQWYLPRATYNQDKEKESMVVCVQPLDCGFSQALRIMEFIEMNKIMGVNHFIFYIQSVSENLNCLLSDYIKQGQITVVEWNIPTKESLSRIEQKHESSLAAFNDCLYQTKSKYEYTMFLSIDEFMVPKEAKSLKDLIRTKEKHDYHKNIGTYIFKVANFYLEWPDEDWRGRNYLGAYLMTIYKTYQTTTDSNKSIKPVCKPNTVLRVGINNIELLPGYYDSYVEELQGLCHRYRLSPGGQTPLLAHALRDTSAHRFAPRLMRALAKQYHKSMPRCTLPEIAKIGHFGPYNTPILL